MKILETYTLTTAAGITATATTATGAATTRCAAAGPIGTLTLAVGGLGLLTSGLGLASELNRDLALEDLLAGELLDGTLGLGRGGKVDKGVANGTVGTRVLGDRNGLTVEQKSANVVQNDESHQA